HWNQSCFAVICLDPVDAMLMTRLQGASFHR
ncbi:unnamed protein product, partial [marine sediment metagenome]